ncbi:MAG: polysaccharide deacetylase family protein [Lachnospiraceae bacterium]|nr:polysaccharide deacetylase family protein [Lachnospiraceae bacterium]
MKRLMKRAAVWLALVVLACSVPTAAAEKIKTTTAKTKQVLANVRKAPKVEGEWKNFSKGPKFRLKTGKYAKSMWISNGGEIYYLNKYGRRTSGWVKYRNATYYLDEAGKLVSGWLNNTYYFKKNGKRVSGKYKIDGAYYYFSSTTGKKVTGWVSIKNKQYYFNKKTGMMATGKWVKKDGKYRYLGGNGAMVKSSWVILGDKKYYVDELGVRVTGEQYIDGKWYYFKKNGMYDPSVKVTSEVDPKKKLVALTFDDGPGPYTARLLACLQRNRARATFFMVGNSVNSYPDTVRQMAKQGCELGCHSYDHSNMTSLSNEGIASQFSRTASAIRNLTGKSPTVARLPYGAGHDNSRVLGSMGYPSIYWSVDTNDWRHTGDSSATVNAVLASVRDGDIVLMHDVHGATVTAAETIIPELARRGFQMVTVSELAKYRGKTTLQSGRTYYNFY